MAYDPNLANGLGEFFGYGTSSTPAYQQLQQQGISGVPTISTGEEEQNAAQQSAALAQLQGMAAGTGPSAAQAQLSAGLQQSIAAQQAAAAGGRYGQNAALRQRQASQTGAGLAAGAANQATQTRAQEQQFGAQAAGSLAGQMRQQSLAGATSQAQLQQGYNQQIAGLYGQEQGQQAQAGQNLQNSLTNSLGGLGALTSLLAHGGVASGTLTRIGERGPELFMPEHGQAKLIDRPGLVRLGQAGKDVVVPLRKGSAPYHHGPAPMHETSMPSKPAPKNPKVMESAKKAMAGKGKVFSPGPGAAGLSPQTAPIVARAMADHGIHPDGKDAKTLLQNARVARAMKYAGGR